MCAQAVPTGGHDAHHTSSAGAPVQKRCARAEKAPPASGGAPRREGLTASTTPPSSDSASREVFARWDPHYHAGGGSLPKERMCATTSGRIAAVRSIRRMATMLPIRPGQLPQHVHKRMAKIELAPFNM